MENKQATCKDRVKSHLKSRIHDLDLLFRAYQNGQEDTVKDKDGSEIGVFNEYGLSFDYVAPGTWDNQRRGYFRYQLSWGGPSDEFRYYTDENFSITSIQYWFMDWGDGAKITLKGKDYNLMAEIFEDFKEIGIVESEHKKAMEDR